MMLVVNGDDREVVGPITLAELVDQVVGSARGTAVAVDGEVVPRLEWDSYGLSDGQRVEVLVAVQGG